MITKDIIENCENGNEACNIAVFAANALRLHRRNTRSQWIHNLKCRKDEKSVCVCVCVCVRMLTFFFFSQSCTLLIDSTQLLI